MKTVLITGVSRGIGKALTQKFLKEGYFVIGTSINGEVDFADNNLKIFQLDLSVPDSIARFVNEVKVFDKKIDILINNAGALFDEDETVVVIDKFRRTLEVNLIGTADLSEKILDRVNDGGHIIFVSSSAGSLAEVPVESHYFGHYPAYKISKCALNMYMRTLSVRMKGKITVSSIHPGWVKTDMGGEEAPMLPEEAAQYIFETATKKDLETGQFWFKGEKFPW